MDRLTRLHVKEIEQQEKTPRTEAAWHAFNQSASAIPFRDEMRKLETELVAEKHVRRNAERVTTDALAKRNQAEADRDAARAERDALKTLMRRAIPTIDSRLTDYAEEFKAACSDGPVPDPARLFCPTCKRGPLFSWERDGEHCVDCTDTAMGMKWWNECTPVERSHLLSQAEKLLGRAPSAADCWDQWRKGFIRMSTEIPPCGSA